VQDAVNMEDIKDTEDFFKLVQQLPV
jgi:hypothetical protein